MFAYIHLPAISVTLKAHEGARGTPKTCEEVTAWMRAERDVAFAMHLAEQLARRGCNPAGALVRVASLRSISNQRYEQMMNHFAQREQFVRFIGSRHC